GREGAVSRGVTRQLRMDGAAEHGALPGEDGLAAARGERRDPWAHPSDAGGPDEHGVEGDRLVPEPAVHARLERLLLPAVRVALHRDVDQTQRGLARIEDLAGQEDQAGAGAVDRPTRGMEAGEGGGEVGRQEEEESRALTARDDEAVQPLELSGLRALPHRHVEPLQGGGVRGEVPLEGEDPDRRAAARHLSHHPRVCSRSASASLDISSPGIASPSSSDTLARMSGSRKWVVAWTMARARVGGSADLKTPEPTKIASAPSCIMSAASAGVATPPAAKLGTGRRFSRATHRTSS